MPSAHNLPIAALFLTTGAWVFGAAEYRAKVSFSWAENVGRASSPVDWIDSARSDAALTAVWSRQLAGNLTATGTANMELGIVPRFDRQAYGCAGFEARLSRKFGLGTAAPVVAIATSAAGKLAAIDAANGLTSRLTLSARKRFAEAWQLSTGLEWMRHDADSATFDVSHRKVWAELSYDPTPHWRISYGYGRLRGNFTANAGPVIWARAIAGQLTPLIATYYRTVPNEVTDSYGPGWVTYNVTGQSRFWWLEVSPALNDTTSLAIRYDSTFTKNIIFVRYRQDLWSLSLHHRF